jgi:hypothetical protein
VYCQKPTVTISSLIIHQRVENCSKNAREAALVLCSHVDSACQVSSPYRPPFVPGVRVAERLGGQISIVVGMTRPLSVLFTMKRYEAI